MNNIETIVSKYLAGEASTEEKEELKKWIAADENNQELFNQYANIWHIAHPAFDPEKIQVEEAYNKIMNQLKYPKYQVLMMYWSKIAAIILLPLLILSTYLFFQPKYQYSSAVYQEIYVPYGNRSKIDLPDGSIAFLNAGSSLKFPMTFSNERIISLVGEGYFEVHSDSEHPFIVKTGCAEVKATGTMFNVEAYKNQPLAVTMMEGKVEVFFEKRQSYLKLRPGEHMEYNEEEQTFRVTQTSPYKWCAWKDGKMIFRNDSLAFLYKKLGNMFNVNFVIKDKELAAHLYHGSFSEESLSTILELLELTAPLTHKEVRKGGDGQRQIEVYKLKNSSLIFDKNN